MKYVIKNPFNEYRQPAPSLACVKVELWTRSLMGGAQTHNIGFGITLADGSSKSGTMWAVSWDHAVNWAQNRVGLRTEEELGVRDIHVQELRTGRINAIRNR